MKNIWCFLVFGGLLGCGDPIVGEWSASTVDGNDLPSDSCIDFFCFTTNLIDLTVDNEGDKMVGSLQSSFSILGVSLNQQADVTVTRNEDAYTIQTVSDQEADATVELDLLTCTIESKQLRCDTDGLGVILLEKQ